MVTVQPNKIRNKCYLKKTVQKVAKKSKDSQKNYIFNSWIYFKTSNFLFADRGYLQNSFP